jgi:hypothetical protein
VRFESILKIHNCFEIFGLIRTDALARTPLMGNYSHGDGVLLARLALLGRFHEIPETLFFFREHPDHSTTRYRGDYRAWAAWFDPNYAGGLVFPLLRMHYEYLRSIDGAPIPPAERVRCYLEVLRWMRWRRAEIAREIGREGGVLARRVTSWAGRKLVGRR